MSWFRKKQSIDKESLKKEARIEIEAHKTVHNNALENANKSNKLVNNLLIQNGFHLELFLAAGGGHSNSDHSKGGR